MEHSQSQIVTAQSMATSIISKIIGINLYFGYSVQAVYTTTGTLGGILALQASVNHQTDLQGNVTFPGGFVTIEDSPVLLTGAGQYIWNLRDTNYSYFQLIYTPAGGDTGILNAYCTIKGV